MAKKKNKGPAVARGGGAPKGFAALSSLLSEEAQAEIAQSKAVEERREQEKARRINDRNPSICKGGRNWVSDEEQTFINPYNFVRFDAAKPPQRKAPENGNLTGWVSCTLTTKTPLIIPDQDKAIKDENEHPIVPFFTLPDATGKAQPVIPGSTLRGAVRALYESASGSCIPVDAGDDITLSTRLEAGGSAKTRALLCYDNAADTWSLQKATAYYLNNPSLTRQGTLAIGGQGEPFTAGQAIRFSVQAGTRKIFNHKTRSTEQVSCQYAIPGAQGQTGYLQFVPPLQESDGVNPRVLVSDGAAIETWPAGDSAPARELAKVLEFYMDNAGATTGENTGENPKAVPYVALNNALNTCKAQGGCVPVWVLEVKVVGGRIDRYITCSSVGRIIMRNTWERLLGKYKSCSDMDALCPACRLFGNAYKDASYAGHLRFGDAHLQADCTAALLPPRTLAELAGPKPTATVFYTERPHPETKNWNYDYYILNQGKNNESKEMIPNPERSLLGRKGYWHHTPAATPAAAPAVRASNTAPQGIAKSKRNCTVTPMDAGASFDFCIYFEQITQQQLDELLWVCTLGENTTSSNLQQKIGFAKPLGYGSVKIMVNEVCTRTLAQNASGQGLCYQVVKADYTAKSALPQPKAFARNGGAIADLLALCDASLTQRIPDTKVCYPLGSNGQSGDNANASHQWFKGNKVLNPTGYVLPAATDTDEGLKLPRIVQASR